MCRLCPPHWIECYTPSCYTPRRQVERQPTPPVPPSATTCQSERHSATRIAAQEVQSRFMSQGLPSTGGGTASTHNPHHATPMQQSAPSDGGVHVQVAIVGTGFSGLGMAIRMKQRGYHDFVVLEKASEIGGTWRDNTYPGCACDIPSHLYCFSFAPNPDWSRAYSPQAEIRNYLRRCAERFGILPHIRWNSELLGASWEEDKRCWRITTPQGRLTATILISGNGPLSEPSLPVIPGIEHFAGTLFHSAQWNHQYQLSGKHIAVIGTGASAIQFIPQIQPQVGQLTLFQRTAPWIVPRLDR